MLRPELEVVQRTHPGRDPNKQENEDAAGYQPTSFGHLLVVCDGMGGHALGQEASQLALRTIVQMVEGAPPGTRPGAVLTAAIAQAGRLVYQMGGTGPNLGRPGSTCVATLVHGGGAEIAHVGDSRAYLVRRGQIWQLTRDHSVVQQMIDLGSLTPEQAAVHPDANKITRALGMRPETEVELRDPAVPFEADDTFVLATDGLCDLVRGDEIAAVVASAPNLQAASEELVRMANARGGHDNITVQLARVKRAAALAPPGPDGPSPTLVEPLAFPAEKTVVDPAPAAPTAPGPLPAAVTIPAVILAPPSPLAVIPPVPFPQGAAPATKTNPGPPSRSGFLALVLGFAVVGLILVGVVAWWILRGR